MKIQCVTIERTLPHVLKFVDLNRLGHRRVFLLLLIHQKQKGSTNPVYLGRKELRAQGLTDRQAKFCHDALVELSKRRIVRRTRGRGRIADAWSLNELEFWRGIKWQGRRDEIVAYFSAHKGTGPVPLWTGRPGQSGFLRTGHRLETPGLGTGLSGRDLSTTQLDMSTTQLRPGQMGAEPGHNATESASGTQLHYRSKDLLNSSSSEEEEEQLRKATNLLAVAIAKQIGKSGLWNTPREHVDRVVRRYPDRLEELHSLIPALAGTLSPNKAAEAFEQRADAEAAAGWKLPATLIRDFEELDDDGPWEANPATLEQIRGFSRQLRTPETAEG